MIGTSCTIFKFVNETMTCNGTHQGLEIELNKNARASIKTYYHFLENLKIQPRFLDLV